MNKYIPRVLALSVAAVVFAACSPAPSSTPTPESTSQPAAVMEQNTSDTVEAQQNIVETAQSAGQFSTLIQAAQVAGLAETLASESQELTVFAPTDEAFAAVPEATLNSLLNNPEQLAEVLKYHVVAGEVMASEVINLRSVETLEGSELSVMTQGNKVMVGGATVLQADVDASNGVIHVIDRVLLPPSMQ